MLIFNCKLYKQGSARACVVSGPDPLMDKVSNLGGPHFYSLFYQCRVFLNFPETKLGL